MSKKPFKVNDKRGATDVETDEQIIESIENAEPAPIVIPDAPENVNLQMCGERILVQLFPKDNHIGKIVLINDPEPNKYRGRILSVGEEVKHLKEGDVVVIIIGYEPATLKASNGEIYAMLPSDAAVAIDRDFENAD